MGVLLAETVAPLQVVLVGESDRPGVDPRSRRDPRPRGLHRHPRAGHVRTVPLRHRRRLRRKGEGRQDSRSEEAAGEATREHPHPQGPRRRAGGRAVLSDHHTGGRGYGPVPLTAQQVAELVDPEGRARPAGPGRLAVRCPAHNDKTPSLTVWVDNNGKAAFNCHAGCNHRDILQALPPTTQQTLETTWKTPAVTVLIPRRRHTPTAPTPPASRNVEAEYPYVTENGELAYLVRRFRGKKIRQFHRNDDGRLVAGRGDAPTVPYRLPDVIQANRAGDTIYIVEGEKDADTLASHGLTATCNVGGAGKWTDNLDGWFAGARVVILPDNDEPGRRHAQDIHRHLQDVAEQTRILNLPGLDDKGDVTDWLENHTVDELEQHAHTPTHEPAGEFALSKGDLIFDIPLEVESIWGQGQESLWARGEPLMIYGPTGIGKTTLAGRLLLSLIGVDDDELLGYPVRPVQPGRTVLYVAADRPRQAMRSLRRMANPAAAPILAERLRIEHMRQIWASEKDPEMLHRAAKQANATIVFIDSGKDLAGGPLKDEGPAKALMDSIQICIANEIDVAMLHHPRKATQEGGTKRQLDLDDVYGSAWLTAGSGSVLLVDGKPGSGEFKFQQLKAPATFVDPLEVAVDYESGAIHRNTTRDIEVWLRNLGMPVKIAQAVTHQYGIPEADIDYQGAQYKKMERRLESLVSAGVVNKTGQNPRMYQWKGPMTTSVPKTPGQSDAPY